MLSDYYRVYVHQVWCW